MSRNKRVLRVLALVIGLALVLAGCAGDHDPTAEEVAEEVARVIGDDYVSSEEYASALGRIDELEGNLDDLQQQVDDSTLVVATTIVPSEADATLGCDENGENCQLVDDPVIDDFGYDEDELNQEMAEACADYRDQPYPSNLDEGFVFANPDCEPELYWGYVWPASDYYYVPVPDVELNEYDYGHAHFDTVIDHVPTHLSHPGYDDALSLDELEEGMIVCRRWGSIDLGDFVFVDLGVDVFDNSVYLQWFDDQGFSWSLMDDGVIPYENTAWGFAGDWSDARLTAGPCGDPPVGEVSA